MFNKQRRGMVTIEQLIKGLIVVILLGAFGVTFFTSINWTAIVAAGGASFLSTVGPAVLGIVFVLWVLSLLRSKGK